MAADGLPVGRLREYLRHLPPGTRVLLIAELERALLRGDEIPGGDLLLQEVRSAAHEFAGSGGSAASAPRFGDAARLFFRPVEPFLFEGNTGHKLHARIARAAIKPLWAWICRDLVPDEANSFCNKVGRALAVDGSAACEESTHAFHDQVAERIRSALAAVQADEKARRRMAGQIGTPSALEDVHDVAAILSWRDALARLQSLLPSRIHNFSDQQIESVKVLLDSPLCSQRGLLPYALIVVMNRLAAPWQLVRLAVRAADSDDAVRIGATSYAAAVTITLDEIERMVGELKAGLRRGAAVTSLLKCIHDTARGLRTELDLAGESAWGRKLAAIRSEIASVLKTEIESMPGRVRRLLQPRPAREIARGAVLNAEEVAETEALIELVGACRNFASELAVNEMTLRAFHELQLYLDTGTQALLDGLRGAGPTDRPFRRSQVDAAVRFCGKVFGQEYASLLTKAAEVATNSERKAGAKA
jgi:hypothetical protein